MTGALPELTDCDREPIHIPGSIQPHGVMLVAESESLVVRYIGGDVETLLGINFAVDRPLADFIGRENAETAALTIKTAPRKAFIGIVEKAGGDSVSVTSHLSGDHLVLELEPKSGRKSHQRSFWVRLKQRRRRSIRRRR